MSRVAGMTTEDIDRLHAATPAPIANAIGKVMAPPVVLVCSTMAVAWLDRSTSTLWWLWAVGVPLIIVGVPVAFLRWQVARGTVEDMAVVRRDQRLPSLLLALGCVVASVAGAVLVGNVPVFASFLVAVLVSCLVAVVVTLGYKVSFHAGVLATVVGFLVHHSWWAAVLCGVLVPCVGWARVRAGRHTLGQVVLGSVLGVTFGWATPLLLQWSSNWPEWSLFG